MQNYVLSLFYYIIIIIYCIYVYVYSICMYVHIYEIWSSLFLKKRFFFFCCVPFLKSLLNLLQYCFCFCFLGFFFAIKHMGS